MSEYAELVARVQKTLAEMRRDQTAGVSISYVSFEAIAEAIEELEHSRDSWRDSAIEWMEKRDAAVADNAAWWAFVDNLSDYETFSPAGEGLVVDMLQANHPGAALLARLARLEAVAAGMVASLSGAATLNAGHEGYTV